MPAADKIDAKNRVIETLDKEGFINDLKARLREKVVKTLEAERKAQLGGAAKYIKPLQLSNTRKVVSQEDGLLCAELIREFLTFYKMEHTLSVFIPEMNLHADFPKDRMEMCRECGIERSQDNDSKPLILNMVEKVRIGDYGQQQSQYNKSPGTDNYSDSPNQMKPHFQSSTQPQQNDPMAYDMTPPTTGIQGSGEDQNSRKNTRNTKQKQSKQGQEIKPIKGAPFDESNSSDKKKNKQDSLTNLGNLPGFGKPKNQFNDEFDNGFDDFDEDQQSESGGNPNNMSKYSNAEKALEEFENDERDGFRVEVKRPGKNKAAPTSKSAKGQNRKNNKFGQYQEQEVDDDQDIEEDIQTERDGKDSAHDQIVESSLGHRAGITVSQSLGIDPSVDSLALDEYDHIEVVEL